MEDLRTCSICKINKTLSEFNKDRTKPLGLKTYCKTCHRKQAGEYAATRMPQYIARAKDWYQKNKDKKKAYDSEWRKDYYHRVKESITAKTNARRRRVRQSMPKWANKQEIQRIYLEASKLSRSTGIQWSVDHIVPISSEIVCGLHVESNLQVIPQVENLSKSNRHWPDMP